MRAALATIPLIALGSLGLDAQETRPQSLRIFANHPSASFVETLGRLDHQERITLSTEEWFTMTEADAWVVFLKPSSELWTQPELVQKVFVEIDEIASDVARVTVGLLEAKTIELTIVDLDKVPENSPDLKGCIAALDLLSLVYSEIHADSATITDACSRY